MVEQVRSGRTPEELSREFEPTAQSIWNWVRQAERDQGVRLDGLTTDEREELRRLRREIKVVREEREILKKAAVDSIGECNIIRSISTRGDVASGSNWTTRTIRLTKDGGMAAMEEGAVA
jgi:transposase